MRVWAVPDNESRPLEQFLFRWVVVSLLGLALTACGGDVSSYSNEGSVCLESASDGTLGVAVMFPTCLSSCDTILDRSCSIHVEDFVIEVESSGSFETPRRGDCSAACGFFSTDCVSPEPLAPGDYTVIHGEDEEEITLPTSGAMIPEDDSPWPSCDLISGR